MTMEISKERRELWERETKNGAFNCWLNPLVRNADGTLNLESLYLIARTFGVNDRYDDLNAGQIRMNIGNRLRSQVPPEIIERAIKAQALREEYWPESPDPSDSMIPQLDPCPKCGGEGECSEDTYEAEGHTHPIGGTQRVTCQQCGHEMPADVREYDAEGA